MTKLINIEVQLKLIEGTLHRVNLFIPEGNISLSDLVEPLQGLTNTIISHELANNSPSSCSKGCDACCSQLIPLSAAEVFYLKRQVNLLPNAQQKKIRHRFTEIHQTLEKYQQQPNQVNFDFEQKYFELKQACPFIDKGACIIYQQRPLVCREYHVSSSPSLCENPYTTNPKRITFGLKLGSLFVAFCSALLGLQRQPIPMIYMKRWLKEHEKHGEKKFSAEYLIEKFFTGFIKLNLTDSPFSSINWQYTPQKNGTLKKDKANLLLLFPKESVGLSLQDRTKIENALNQGLIYLNGPQIQPTVLAKRLTQNANAENIKDIFSILIDRQLLPKKPELFIEIGSGEGYLKYLMSLVSNQILNNISQRLIETEFDKKIVSNNLSTGKRTLCLDSNNLTKYFGKEFTPMVVSMNVHDLFSPRKLSVQLQNIRPVLKEKGLIIHIMSSAIHPAIYEDIKSQFPGKSYLPYYRDGLVGVRLVSSDLIISKELRTLSDEPGLLAMLFGQSPAHYIDLSKEADNLIFDHNNTDCILLHKFSCQKIVTSLEGNNFKILLHQKIENCIRVNRTNAHKSLGDVNYFHNQTGAMMTNKILKQKKDWSTEKSTFYLIVGQKI